ncbi:MAG: Na+/H+ antiporter NhaA [Desulfovibrionaceae bacterium]|nr:Na+/H+ antiporter NhaA [Desulfovibrionaceae bacterium]
MLSKALKDFAHVQALAGLWTVIALILVLPARYALPRLFELVAAPVSLSSGPWTMIQPGIMWVNGIGAALIFLLIGLEIKRGFMEDELTGADRLRLPALAAVGGVAIPVLAHMVLHGHEPALARAWIIPAASDMALGLGVLALFGDKAPSGLRLFFLTTCLFMNAGALLVAGGIQATHMSPGTLGAAGVCLALLLGLNLARIGAFSVYALVGIALWSILAVSGPASALAGLFVAMAFPMQVREQAVLERTEHDLHRAVGLVLMPALAFLNAGTMGWEMAPLSPWALGIAASLFVGKQVGILGLCWLGTTTGLCALPPGVGWKELHGAAVLCAIGGGMSLIWSALDGALPAAETAGAVLAASALAALAGFGILRFFLGQRRNKVLPRT